MAIYRIADLDIQINNKHSHTDIICANYLSETADGSYDFSIEADEADFAKDRLTVPEATDGYLEALSVYRGIANKLIDYDGFVLHACIVERNGFGFAFSAKSGTGKTTHSRLWLKRYSDARIINGDKPLIRITDGKIYAYGTPWCGKENFNINCKTPLSAICFLERSDNNSITRISKAETVKRLYSQLLMPKEPEKINKLFDLVENLVELVPAYVLKCNISVEAAEVAYNAMSQGVLL